MVSGGWVRGGSVRDGWVRGGDGEATSRAADVVSVAVSELMMLFAVTVEADVSAAAAVVVSVAVSGLIVLLLLFERFTVLSIWRSYATEGIAQLAGRPTEKPAQY